ncbi:MAG TPA: hypothetical protein DIU45_00255 [Clostridium sp.]|nr:hypothetical protein [Clostridium sp.]
MNIKGLDKIFTSATKSSSPIDSEIKTLEDQKTTLMQQLSLDKGNNSLDMEKIKEINNQIQDIDKEIQKKQIEKLKESQKIDIESMMPKDDLIVSGKNESKESIIANGLINASNMHKHATIMNSAKSSLRREINILKTEVNSSKKKDNDIKDENIEKAIKNKDSQLFDKYSGKLESVSKLENRLEKINDKVIEKAENINQHLNDAIEEANRKDISNDADRNKRIEERKDRDIRKKKLKEAQIQHIKKLENIVEDYAEFKVNSLIK